MHAVYCNYFGQILAEDLPPADIANNERHSLSSSSHFDITPFKGSTFIQRVQAYQLGHRRHARKLR